MNIYRNRKTGRLVKLYRNQPRMILGSWLETEDYFTGQVHRLSERGIHSLPNLELVGQR